MATNSSRSMTQEIHQGSIDSTYIQLTPDRGNVENPPLERLSWPTYRQVEKHGESPFLEAHLRRSVQPVEYKTRGMGDSDNRF